MTTICSGFFYAPWWSLLRWAARQPRQAPLAASCRRYFLPLSLPFLQMLSATAATTCTAVWRAAPSKSYILLSDAHRTRGERGRPVSAACIPDKPSPHSKAVSSRCRCRGVGGEGSQARRSAQPSGDGPAPGVLRLRQGLAYRHVLPRLSTFRGNR